MRPHSPWFRKQTQCYYVEIAGQQINLGKDRKEAMRRFHRLMADGVQHTAPVTITVATLADLFLEWCKDENTAETYDWYKRFLQEFCELHGSRDVASLKPFHVNGWVKRWKNPTTRRCGLIDGMPSNPFSLRTLPPDATSFEEERAEIVRRTTRHRYAKPVSQVQAEICRDFSYV